MRFLIILAMVAVTPLTNAGGRSGGPNLMDRFMEANTKETRLLMSSSQSGMLTEDVQTDACHNAKQIKYNSSALVFNKLALLESKFSFDSILQQIIATSPIASHLPLEEMVTSKEDLLSSLLQSFTEVSATNQGIAMELDLRPEDAALNNDGQLSSDMKPLGLFNRLDLADDEGKHCGEYRIAFGRENAGNERFLMIFEAQYPNPQPELGLAGCTPVVNFWASLDRLSDQDALVKLHEFFMTGTAQDGVTLPAAVNYQNFSADRGQVRVNSVVTRERWQLREFKTAINPISNTVEFSHVTAKANPLTELYAYSPSRNIEAFNALGDSFKQDFIANMLPQLLAPELNGKTSAHDIINGIFLDNDDKYNEFQSNSQTPAGEDDRLNAATVSDNFLSDQMINDFINEKTQQSNIDHGITREMVLNRANAMTCHGCHMTTLDAYIAPDIKWPSILPESFVHVSDRKNAVLSTALTQEFLPARQGVMEDFICNPPAIASNSSNAELLLD